MSNSNVGLNREGRKPCFTRELALTVLKARIMTAADNLTVDEFTDLMFQEKEIPRRFSTATMRKLLGGYLFPDLVDVDTGEKFDYSALPVLAPGRPPTYAKKFDPATGEPRKRLTRIRRDLMNETLDQTARIVEKKMVAMSAQVQRRVEENMEAQLAEFGRRLAIVEKQVSPVKEVQA